MIDVIMSAAAQIILFILSLIVYIFLVACLLPKILLKPKYKIEASDIKDRGLKRFAFDGGHAIAYQPSVSAGKYIKQYILSSNGDEKYIKCQTDERIFSLKYDVIAFDSSDKLIDTVQITERIKTGGVSRAALLPANTAYVTLVVKEVNGVRADKDTKLAFSAVKLGIFAFLTVLLTAAESLIFNAAVRYFADNVLNVSINSDGALLSLLLSAVSGLFLAAVILLFHWTKDTKIGK